MQRVVLNGLSVIFIGRNVIFIRANVIFIGRSVIFIGQSVIFIPPKHQRYVLAISFAVSTRSGLRFFIGFLL